MSASSLTSSNRSPRLEARNLGVQRGDRLLFSDLQLQLHDGEAVFVTGANGAGKTSLLRTLCGLSRPAKGTIHWCGEAIDAVREEYLARLLYVGHRSGNKDELSCQENLAVSLGTAGRRTTLEERYEALAQVGLRGREEMPARYLSQGQQRRLSLARITLSAAALWILDEPFNALDAQASRWLRGRMERHLAEGGMVVFTSHQEVELQGDLKRLQIGGR